MMDESEHASGSPASGQSELDELLCLMDQDGQGNTYRAYRAFRAPGARCESEPEAAPSEAAPWPELSPAAIHGLAGDIVRMLDPLTEADPVALLIHILLGIGNLWGRKPHYRVGGSRHHTNLSAVLVGATSSGRKGTARSDVMPLLGAVDSTWSDEHVVAELSSGEGLIYQVRDPIERQEPIRGKNRRIEGYQTVVVDPGIDDKRLFVIESEFASVLRVASRDGNTLSTTLRQAWDSGKLRVMNKNSPIKSTGCHVSVVGHVTRDELLSELTQTNRANGFANRFLWLCVSRSKLLPNGGDWSRVDFAPIHRRLADAVEFARDAGEIQRDPEAAEMWSQVYADLSRERLGMVGAICSRAEAQTLRLSCIYALLDRSPVVRHPHLEAALVVWNYSEASARFIFGDAVGNEVADRILSELRRRPEGMTQTDISGLFKRHRSAAEIRAALRILAEHGLVRTVKEESGGRPVERWFAATQSAKKAK